MDVVERRDPHGRTLPRSFALRFEVGGHLVRVLRLEEPADLLLGVRIGRRADPSHRVVDVVGRSAQLHVGAEQRPEAPRRPSYGMPTLPALTYRRPATARSTCTWTWPATTTRSSTPASAAANASSGVTRVTISSSRRGVAWQNSVGPRPSTSSVAVRGVREEGALLLVELRDEPAAELAIRVAADEHGALERREALAGHRASADVPAARSRRRPRARLREHRLERRQVAVDVVERRDPHGPDAIAPAPTRSG